MFETADPVKQTEAQEGQEAEGKQLRERIPCPFDPSQYVSVIIVDVCPLRWQSGRAFF